MDERLRRVFRESFGVDSLDDELAIGDVKGWDSLGHIGLMMVLQQEFGVKISPARAVELVSVREIKNFLKQETCE
jgi:acyl carrier protein